MLEKRKNQRLKTLAKVRIPGILDGESLLKDLSITGCRVECTAYSAVKPEKIYQLEIIPEQVAKVDNFTLEAEMKWIRSTGYSGEIGFNIVASPKGRQFQRYVDYLVYRSTLPETEK